jgi:hypothetical protein
MPLISPSIIVKHDEPDLLAHIRERASSLFNLRGTVRCQGRPLSGPRPPATSAA